MDREEKIMREVLELVEAGTQLIRHAAQKAPHEKGLKAVIGGTVKLVAELADLLDVEEKEKESDEEDGRHETVH